MIRRRAVIVGRNSGQSCSKESVTNASRFHRLRHKQESLSEIAMSQPTQMSQRNIAWHQPSLHIVATPAASRFADWSKRCHVMFVIIERVTVDNAMSHGHVTMHHCKLT